MGENGEGGAVVIGTVTESAHVRKGLDPSASAFVPASHMRSLVESKDGEVDIKIRPSEIPNAGGY